MNIAPSSFHSAAATHQKDICHSALQEADQGGAGAAQQGEHADGGGGQSAGGRGAGQSPEAAHQRNGGADEEDRGRLQRAGGARRGAGKG